MLTGSCSEKEVCFIMTINNGMYSHEKDDILAYGQFIQNFALNIYYHVPQTIRLWTHTTRKTRFCLSIDDFGIQYQNQDGALYLIISLQHHYEITLN